AQYVVQRRWRADRGIPAGRAARVRQHAAGLPRHERSPGAAPMTAPARGDPGGRPPGLAQRGQLGIDLGGTKVAFLTRHQDAARTRYLWPETGRLEGDIDALGAWCHAARESYPGTICSVGAAVPATLDRDGRVVTWPSRPNWAGFPLLAFLEGTFPN